MSTVDFQLLGRVESSTQCDYLRKYGHVVVADAVAGFVPPVVGWDVKTVHRHGTIHHQADFLLWSEQRQQVVGTLFHREVGILEGVVVVLAPDSEQRDSCSAK